jgi:hypothetical protein
MSFIKRQSIHSRKVGDNTFILTSDGDMEMNLAEGKEFRVNADMVVNGTASGPKTQNIYYVTEEGSDDNDGLSQDANGAFASVKKAAEVAPEGSLIIVAPGDYYENNPITLRDFVTVSGQGELRNTRIFPKNNTDDLFFMGNGCYLFQMTFRGLRYPGWCARIRPGALVTTSPYVQNCTNMNGPWLNDGTEFIPFETVQIEGIEPGARPLTLEDNPSLPVAKQVNPTGGGGGILVDGDEYDPASLVFSFVADAFTQISQGGIGFHITNFGYTQIVSCFSVFCSVGFLTTKGGYLSISNSVSDFGTEGVVADGFYPIAYTEAIPTQDYFSTVASVTMDFAGLGYTSSPSVVFDPPLGAGGITATGTANIDITTGTVSAVTITNPGSGYTEVPQVRFIGGGASVDATGDVNLSGNSEVEINSLTSKPQTGSIIKFEEDPTYYYITANEISRNPFSYNQEICKRDIRRIIDAITSDIVFGTYYQTTAAATSYLRSTSKKVLLDQLEPTIYALEQVRDEMKLLTTNLALKEEIDQRFNIVTTTLNAGDSSVTEYLGSDYAATLNDLSTIDREIIEAKDNILANRDFIIEELTAYINDQFTELSYNQAIYETELTEFLTGMAYFCSTGSNHIVVRQAQEFSYRERFKNMFLSSFEFLRDRFVALSSVAAEPQAVTNVNESFNILRNVIDDGDSSGIVSTFPASTGSPQNSIDAKDHIQINKDFILAEWIAYLDSVNTTITYDVAEWRGYVENLLDALCHDLMYSGNAATKQEAEYIFNSVTWSNFTTTDIQNIEDAFARIRFILQRVIRGLTVTATAGNTESQDFSSGDATQVEANIVDGLVQIVETTIDSQSTSGIGTKTYPVIEDEPAGQQAATNQILGQVSNEISAAIAYNLGTNPTLTYNVEKCKRDVGYIIDAVYRDSLLGTNHHSITAGLSYSRANTAYLDTEQKPATIIALRKAKELAVEASNTNAVFQQSVSDLFDDIFNIIEFDQLPSEGQQYPSPGPAAQELINAHAQLVANKSFLQADVVAYINNNNFTYDETKCRRDTGLIVDGAAYDAFFGTNYNSVTNGLAYQRANSTKVIADQLTETVAAISYAKGEASTIVASDVTTQTRVEAAFDEVIDILQNGVVSTDTAADPLVFPSPNPQVTNNNNARDQLQNNRDFLAAEAVAYIENNYQDFIYDQDKCERDVGLIMDAVALDVALGTNYNQVTAGLAYQRASNAYLQSSQKIQTLGALGELKKQIVLLGLTDNAQPIAEAAVDEVIDILENGVISTDTAADALVFPTPGTLPTTNAVEAKDQLIANKNFIIAEILAYIAQEFPSLTYDSNKCQRDVGYIIDAVCHDLMYGGNSATITVANSYFVNGVSQLGSPSEEAATANAYDRLRDVIGDVVIEAAVVTTPGNTTPQDTAGTPASSTEADDAEGLVQIITDVIAAGNLNSLPATQLPDITWAASDLQQAYNTIKANKELVQENIIIWIANNFQSFSYDEAKCRRDVAAIVEAVAYDAAIGTNYNSVTAGLAYQRANSSYVLSGQNLQTIKAIEYLAERIQAVDSLNSLFKTRVQDGINEILDIIQNGEVSTDTAADPIVFPDSGLDANYSLAVTQLQANRDFAAQETIAFVANNYPGVVANPAYDADKCARDVKYIVDAVCYDIMYRGNLATKIAAESYFVGTESQLLDNDQKIATVAAYNELQNVLSDIVQNIVHGTVEQSPVVVSQDTTNPGASAVVGAEAAALVGIIEFVIDNGTLDNIPADDPTNLTWVNAALSSDNSELIGRTARLQNEVISYIDYTFTRDFTFNSTKCERDTKYIIDALTYDILYGGNSATHQAASSYYVGAASQVSGQQTETSNALGWVDTLLGQVLLDQPVNATEQTVETQDTTAAAATSAEVDRANELIGIIQNVIENGTDQLPTIVYPDISSFLGANTEVQALFDAKDTIVEGTINFLETTYNAFSYDQDKCSEDTGQIIDAVAWDLLYTGNIATLIATRAYFLGAANYLPDEQKDNTVAAYAHLQSVVESCIEGAAVTPQAGNTESQVLLGAYGSNVESAIAVDLIGIVKDAVDNQTLVGTPGEIEADYSWLPLSTRTAGTALLSSKLNIQNGVIDFINNSIIGFEYNTTKCQRDTGYIIDAVIYDTMYGGNKQSRRAGEAYYSGAILNNLSNTDYPNQSDITAYTYFYLGSIMKKIAANDPVTRSYNNVEDQVFLTNNDANTATGDNIKLLVDRIGQAVLEGYTTGWTEVPHNHELGSAVYNTERNTILASTEDIVQTSTDRLNFQFGGIGTITVFPAITSVTTDKRAALYNVSTISTSGHAFEYVGAGVTYNALPFFGGTAIPEQEIIERNQGRVFAGGTVDQIGNFRVGNFFGVNALTGAITLNANEIDLSGLTSVGPFIRDGVPVGVELKEVSDNANLVSSIGTQDFNTAPTQKAVATYVENRYLNKLTGGTVNGNTTFDIDVTVDGTLILTNTDLEVQYGGTGVSEFTEDGILYGNADSPVQVTDAAGTSDISDSFQVLTVTSDSDATPIWTDTLDGGSF